MKKSQLRKIIRESIREMVEEKQMLNEIEGCHFSFTEPRECGPSYCRTHTLSNGAQSCACNSWIAGTDECDQSDTGGSIGVSSDLGGMSKDIEAGDIEPILPSTDKKYSMKEAAEEWCTCRYYRCKRDNTQTDSTLSWGGCTGSGACGCMSGFKTAVSTKF